MTYDYELFLIEQTEAENEIGDPIAETESTLTVLCGLKSIGRQEFYSAAAAGLKPENVFVMHKYEYMGQKLVEFEGIRYKVLRTYTTGIEEIELTCEGLLNGVT